MAVGDRFGAEEVKVDLIALLSRLEFTRYAKAVADKRFPELPFGMLEVRDAARWELAPLEVLEVRRRGESYIVHDTRYTHDLHYEDVLAAGGQPSSEEGGVALWDSLQAAESDLKVLSRTLEPDFLGDLWGDHRCLYAPDETIPTALLQKAGLVVGHYTKPGSRPFRLARSNCFRASRSFAHVGVLAGLLAESEGTRVPVVRGREVYVERYEPTVNCSRGSLALLPRFTSREGAWRVLGIATEEEESRYLGQAPSAAKAGVVVTCTDKRSGLGRYLVANYRGWPRLVCFWPWGTPDIVLQLAKAALRGDRARGTPVQPATAGNRKGEKRWGEKR